MSEFPIKPVEKTKKEKKNFLSFVNIPPKKDKKTQSWMVSNTEHHVAIGEVKWYGAWRKYCFFPHKDTVHDSKCLGFIQEFLDKVNADWKAQKKKEKKA